MPKKPTLPLVAICGRPNVGKSTLFNRLAGKQRAIVHGLEGITRDRFFTEVDHDGRRFRLVDTGGIVEAPVDPVSEKMQRQVRAALDEAHAIVFVVDGQQEITRVDQQVRDALFRYGKPVILAANKLDNERLAMQRFDFYELGLGEPYAVSATHGIGVDALMSAIVEHLPEHVDVPAAPETPVTRVAVIGKPNVGKSSFVNAILNEERTIVDERPGTTRDAIDVEFRWQDREYLLIDTAGMRRKAGIREAVEHYSVTRSLRAVRRADVCLVLIDAMEGITEQDKRILGYVREQGTAMVMVWTKWDLVEDREKEFKGISEQIDLKMPYMRSVPFVTVSNITRQRLFRVFEFVDRVAAEAAKRIGTAELNNVLEEVRLKHKPPSQKGKQAKIYYATQASVKPTTFVFFVNQKKLFHFSYMRYIENQIRDRYGFEGVPIRLELREGKPRE